MDSDAVAHGLRDVASQLKGAADLDAVLLCLADAKRVLTYRWPELSPLTARGLERHHDRFMDVLLERVLSDWVPCMTDAQRSSCFDCLLVNASIPRHITFLACVRALRDTRIANEVVALVRSLLWPRDCAVERLRAMLQEADDYICHVADSAATSTLRTTTFVNAIVSLPDYVANALQKRLPSWLAAGEYYQRTSSAMLQLLQATHERSGESTALQTTLLAKLARQNRCDQVMDVWAPALIESHRSAGQGSCSVAVGAVLASISDAEFEAMLLALLRRLPLRLPSQTGDEESTLLLSAVLSLRMQRSAHCAAHCKYLLSQKLIVDHRVANARTGRQTLRCTINYLAARDACAGNPKLPSVQLAIDALVSAWCGVDFVDNSTLSVHRHTTYALLYCLDALRAAKVKELADTQGWVKTIVEENDWVTPIMYGVQRRLGSPLATVRSIATRVAAHLSLILRPGNPLRFHDTTTGALENMEDSVDFMLDTETGQSEWLETPGSCSSRGQPGTANSEHGEHDDGDEDDDAVYFDNPDAVVSRDIDRFADDVSSDFGSNSESDDVVSLDAYDFSNLDSGGTATTKPRHIHELMAWLRLPKDPSAEDYARFDGAMAGAEDLIRSPTSRDTLEHEAAPLLMQLLNLPGSPSKDGARKLAERHRAMTAVIGVAPETNVCLARAICTPGSYNLDNRLRCMDVLIDAAMELANLTSQHGPDTGLGVTSRVDASNSKPIHTSPADDGKTRRWGHTARLKRDPTYVATATSKPNGFAAHANEFFWGLLWGLQHNS